MSDQIGHYCGLFAVYGHKDAVELTYLALYAQQHRGEEAAGICSSDGSQIVRFTGSGLVADVFDPEVIARLTAGRELGWPYCNPEADGFVRDVQTNAGGSELDCAALPPVEQTLGAHSAPLGLSFSDGVLPEPFMRHASVEGLQLQSGARGMAFNANMVCLIQFLNMGTQAAPGLR